MDKHIQYDVKCQGENRSVIRASLALDDPALFIELCLSIKMQLTSNEEISYRSFPVRAFCNTIVLHEAAICFISPFFTNIRVGFSEVLLYFCETSTVLNTWSVDYFPL